jgi:hypothetical protein
MMERMRNVAAVVLCASVLAANSAQADDTPGAAFLMYEQEWWKGDPGSANELDHVQRRLRGAIGILRKLRTSEPR